MNGKGKSTEKPTQVSHILDTILNPIDHVTIRISVVLVST